MERVAHGGRRHLVALAVALWAMTAGGATLAYTLHASVPGIAATAPRSWPSGAGLALARDPSRPTLLVLVHPMCPCSRATLRELARVLAHRADKVAVHIVFLRPSHTGTDPRTTPLWAEAREIAGAAVTEDVGGTIAAAFGAATSGQTYLYGADGSLLFQGGITQAGGHEGDNAGRDALEARLDGDGRGAGVASVFGCSLFF